MDNEPDGVDEWHVLQFGNDYAAGHPVWLPTGLAALDELRLSASLSDRLQAWSAYWESHSRFEKGWIPGECDDWFEREEAELPQAIAAELGHDFAVETRTELIRSTSAATNPAAAAAMQTIATELESQHRRIADYRARGRIVAANISLQHPTD